MAASASNCGKTVASLGLACALRKRGIHVCAAKSGPDYIDRSWLSLATGKAAPNLDLWMANGQGGQCFLKRLLKNLFEKDSAGFLLVEGAMGLYDGSRQGGFTSAELALFLGLPVCLLLKIEGMGQSCAAMAQGFLEYQPEGANKLNSFLGIICTHSGSVAHEELAAKALKPVLEKHGLPLFGFLPKRDAPVLPSRHLGLVQAEEREAKFEKFASWFEDHCDVNSILERLNKFFPQLAIATHKASSKLAFQKEKASVKFLNCHAKRRISGSRPRIAIAHDAAFAFIYADFPALLQMLGAELRFFSPLEDKNIPDCDGVYLPGGYPEIFAEKLSSNEGLLRQLHGLLARNIPVYAECGGFIYLGEKLLYKGECHEMSGVAPFSFEIDSRLQALGYRQARLLEKPEIYVRGHVFHYGRICGEHKGNLWLMENGSNYIDGWRNNSVWASWLHLYPAGSMAFWKYWLECVKRNMNE